MVTPFNLLLKNLNPQKLYWLCLSILAVIGSSLVLYSTVWGAGLISDSFQYIATAKTMVSHGYWGYLSEDGTLIPLTQYPPFFPAVLAFLEWLGIHSLVGVRFLNVVLMGLNIILVGESVRHITQEWLWGLIAALLFVSNRVFLEAHSWALSEPLYYFLSLLGMLILVVSLEHENKHYWITAIIFGLAALTRYIGLVLILTGMIGLLWGRKPLREKGARSIGFGIVSFLPLGLWTLRNILLTETINNRLVSFVPLTLKNVLSIITTILNWFIPANWILGHEKIVLFLFLVTGFCLLGLSILGWKRTAKPWFKAPWLHPLSVIWLIAALGHFGFLIMAKIGFDHNIGFGDRLLSPVWLGGIVFIVALAATLWQEQQFLQRGVVILLGGYLILYFIVGSTFAVTTWHKQGLGLARKSWHTSEVIQILPTFDTDHIYSNSPSTMYLWAGSPGHSLAEFDQIRQTGSATPAYLVVFHHIPINPRLQRLSTDLPILIADQIATIYRYPP